MGGGDQGAWVGDTGIEVGEGRRRGKLGFEVREDAVTGWARRQTRNQGGNWGEGGKTRSQ